MRQIFFLFILSSLFFASCKQTVKEVHYPDFEPDFFSNYLSESDFLKANEKGLGYFEYAKESGWPEFEIDSALYRSDSINYKDFQIGSFYNYGILCELYKVNLSDAEGDEYLGLVYPYPMMGTMNLLIFSGDASGNKLLAHQEVLARNWVNVYFKEFHKKGVYDIIGNWDQRSIVMYNNGIDVFAMQGDSLKKIFDMTSLLEFDYPGNPFEMELGKDEAVRELKIIHFPKLGDTPQDFEVDCRVDFVKVVHFEGNGSRQYLHGSTYREYEITKRKEKYKQLWRWDSANFRYKKELDEKELN